jgi:hypothetical protein
MLTTMNTCLHCGTVNQAAELVCVTCGGGLTVDRAFNPLVYEPIPDPDLFPDIQPFCLTDAVSTTLKLFTKYLWLITKIVFVIATPLEIFKATSFANAPYDPQLRVVTLLLGAACNVVIAPALIYALMKDIQTGNTPSLKESFSWGLSKIPHFAVCAAAAYFVQWVGYLLCVIPGIIIGLKYAVVYPVAILEDQSIREVFDRSNNLTRGSRLQIFAAQLLIAVLWVGATFLLSLFMGSMNSAPLSVVASVIIDIVEQLPTVLAFVIYLSLLKTAQQMNPTTY